MSQLHKLKIQKKNALDEATKLVNASESEDREMTAEEVTAYDDYMATAKSLVPRIERLEATEIVPVVEDATVVTDDKEANVVITGGEPVIMKDPARGYADVGEFAMNVKARFADNIIDPRLATMAAATGHNQASGPDGGYAVPPQFATEIYDGVMGDSNGLLSMADTYPVTGESLTIPAIDETSRKDGYRQGGIQAYWMPEAAQMSESKTKLRQVKVEPQGLGVLMYVTDKLLKNGPALTRYIMQAAPKEINFKVGDAIIDGDGVGKPKGILQSGAVVEVAKETSQAAKTIVAGNIENMWSRLLPGSWGNAVWFINQDVMPQLNGVNIPSADVKGTQTVGGYREPLYNNVAMTLKGRPIIPLEFCNTLGTAGDIILGDMNGYFAGTQGTLETAMSMHLRFDYNETAFRFMFNVDGQTWLKDAVTPYKGTNKQSHFITLADRS